MKRFGFVIEAVSDQSLELFKVLHKAVPTEITGPDGALQLIGVHAMTIHWFPPRNLFMQVEADDSFDPLSDFTRALDLHPAVKAWDDRMYIKEPLLKRVVGNTTQLNWFLMDQVFDWQRYPESEEVVCAV
jgi:hypothetical protein